MSERVRIAVADHVATVTLSRPEKHNALDAEMFLGLDAAAARLRDEPGVRAVVLHGEGKSFCSGLDIASFMGGGPLTTDDLMGRPNGETANLAQRVCVAWQDVPVPVIVAIHGNCFGGGLQIALGGDLRIAAPDARLSVLEIKLGPRAGHGDHADAAPARRHRPREGAHLTGRRLSGGGGLRARARHGRRRGPARRRAGARRGHRLPLPRRDPRGEAAVRRGVGGDARGRGAPARDGSADRADGLREPARRGDRGVLR